MLSRALFPIGIGTDICAIPRIYKTLTSNVGPKFVQRILTKEELQLPKVVKLLACVSSSDHRNAIQHSTTARDGDFWRAATFIAGRFAAKEATMKAYSIRRLYWHDIVIARQADLLDSIPSGKALMDMVAPTSGQTGQEPPSEDIPSSQSSTEPSAEPLTDGPPVAIIKGDGVYKDAYAPISISHDGDYATAVCLAFLMEKNA
ncbi:hypothetical protein F5B20DRAFT_167914 [Whalleya microplaca]|nr:hypothetical protein F5B20DRAFT_167914 [Whalleya microplaca]